MKTILLLTFFCSFGLYAQTVEFKRYQLNKKSSLNTFVFWINGDADRFRPSTTHDSKVKRLDVIELERIKVLAKKCHCNVVIFHDQRGSANWRITGRKKSLSYIYAYSSGELVRFKQKLIFKKHLSFKETDQTDVNFMSSFYRVVQKLFPSGNKHLIYRGHSFNGDTAGVDRGFDLSNKNSRFGIDKFMKSIKATDIKFSIVTFAACSMADIRLVLELSNHSKFLIASQVNIHESGMTGFSYQFLKRVNNFDEAYEVSQLIGHELLNRFNTVADKKLYLRETPLSIIDLSKIFNFKYELEAVLNNLINSDFDSLEKITIYPSLRYIKLREMQGASSKLIKIIKKKFKVVSFQNDYDLISLLTNN